MALDHEASRAGGGDAEVGELFAEGLLFEEAVAELGEALRGFGDGAGTGGGGEGSGERRGRLV